MNYTIQPDGTTYNKQDRTIAHTNHIKIVKRMNYYIVWWFELGEIGYSKLYTRDRAFRFAYTLLREYRKQKSGYYDCIK